MATAVFLHAHPDDESIATAGTMARLADAGHRVVMIVATRGELGEAPRGVVVEGETLADRREAETRRSADVLGVARVVLLGYRDSGMAGEPANDVPGCFWRADVEEAASRVAGVLGEEDAEVLVSYDPGGGYGHPDHVQVHRVGARAGDLAGTSRVYEVTFDRDHLRSLEGRFADVLDGLGVEVPGGQGRDMDTFGTPGAEITTRVDVTPVLERKRASMRAHASQISEHSFFLALPDDAFAAAFGTEWYIRRGAPPDERWLLDEPEPAA